MYNICFLAFLLINIYSVGNNKFKQAYYHMIAIGATAATFFLNYEKDNLGRNKYGTCSIKKLTTSSQIAGLTTLTISSIGAVIVFAILRRYIPNHTRRFAALKRNFTNFYSTYLKLNIYVWFTVLIAFIAQNTGQNNNPYYSPNPGYDPHDSHKEVYRYTLLFNLGKFGNIAKVINPIIVFIVRLSDPQVNLKVKYFFKGCCKRKEESKDKIGYTQELKGTYLNTSDHYYSLSGSPVHGRSPEYGRSRLQTKFNPGNKNKELELAL
jgi:hypothetical protein